MMESITLTLKDVLLLVSILGGAVTMGVKLGAVQTALTEMATRLTRLETTVEQIAPRPVIRPQQPDGHV